MGKHAGKVREFSFVQNALCNRLMAISILQDSTVMWGLIGKLVSFMEVTYTTAERGWIRMEVLIKLETKENPQHLGK